MADNNDKLSFWETPLGIIVILLIVILGIGILGAVFGDKGSTKSYRNNLSNNNYFRRGEWPPSLAGYI